MAVPRNPGGPSTGPPSDRRGTAPYGSGEEERTAVEPDSPNVQGRWEEKTVAEKGAGVAKGPPRAAMYRGSDEITAAGEDSGQFLVDTGVTQDEAAARQRRIAAGTGETGSSSIDAPTVEESAALKRARQPLPPSHARVTERAPAQKVPEPASKLVVLAGSDRGREFPLEAASITVGRGVENDVILTDISVSRKHLRIESENGRHYLVDLESGNGTLVNDEEVRGRRLLKNADRLELGNTVLRINCPELPAVDEAEEIDEEARTVAGRQPPLPPPGQLPLSETGDGAMRRSSAAREPASSLLPSTPPGANRRAETPPVYPTLKQSQQAPMQLPQSPPQAHAPMQLSQSSSQVHAPMQPRNTLQGPAPAAPVRGNETPSVIQALGAIPIQSTIIPAYPVAPSTFQAPNAQAAARSKQPDSLLESNPLHARRGLIVGLSIGAIGLYAVLIVLSVIFDGGPSSASRQAEEVAAAAKAETAKAETAKTETKKAETKKTATKKTETAKAATAKTETAKAETAKTETGKTETAKAETAQTETKAETAKTETAKAETAKAETAKTETAKTETAKTETAKTEAAANAASKTDVVASNGPGPLKALVTSKAAKTSWGTQEDFVASLPGTKAPETATTPASQTNPQEKTREIRTAQVDETESTKQETERAEEPRATQPSAAERAVENARRKAKQQYSTRSFAAAARTLRDVAMGASKKDQAALRRDADDFDQLAALLLEARRAETENPPAALTPYRKALAIDSRYGGEHRAFIQERRGMAAADAAASYMARDELLKAKQAADVAEQAGLSGKQLVLVRRSLERKAQGFYDEALKLSRSNAAPDRDKARAKAKEARAIVPTSSPVHEKATKLIEQLKG